MFIPTDLYFKIFSYLQIYEQEAITPQVCQQWFKWQQEKKRVNLIQGDEFPHSLKEFVNQGIDSSQVEVEAVITKLVLNNPLITRLKVMSLPCRLTGKSHSYSYHANLFSEQLGDQFKAFTERQIGKSKELKVCWSYPNSQVGLNKRGKEGDYRFKANLSIQTCTYWIQYPGHVLRKLSIEPIVYIVISHTTDKIAKELGLQIIKPEKNKTTK